MIDPHHEAALVNGGDCFSHWHSTDRVVDHGTLQQLQQLVRETDVTTTPYTVTPSDDILLCGIAATVTLPLAKNGREIEVIQTGTSNVTVNLAGADTIYGSTSVLLNAQGMALRFKAITGGWVLL
jgi:hypothetical protein